MSSKTYRHLRARQVQKYCNWNVPQQKPGTVSLACWWWQHLTAGDGHGRAASTPRLRCPKSPFPVSRSAKASALACACDCLQVPPYHSVTRQGTMPSQKRRKRLPAYFNFSDALLPHVAPIALERGAGAVTGQSGAAVSCSRQTRTAEQYGTDPTNAQAFTPPLASPYRVAATRTLRAVMSLTHRLCRTAWLIGAELKTWTFLLTRSSPRAASLRVASLSASGISLVAPAFLKDSTTSCVKQRTLSSPWNHGLHASASTRSERR